MTDPGPVLALVPGPHGPGTGANTRAAHLHAPVSGYARARDGYWLKRDGQHVAASRFDPHAYTTWLDHIWPAAGCTHPIRLSGQIHHVSPATGEVVSTVPTSGMPDGIIYKACGNRRTSACPSCAETYRRDAFQLIRAGLIGGKGIPEHIATHPAVFATFTAPSFGPVHARPVRLHTCADKAHCTCRPQPCHARRDPEICPHGRTVACFTRHRPGDPVLGQPLCPDCYDHHAHVVWNNAAGELWRRTKQAIERHLNQLARHRGLPYGVRVSHGKAAEYQARGAVHFHVLLRLDGLDPDDRAQLLPPPPGLTVADLEDATRHAAAITCQTPHHPASPGGNGWVIGWGDELDVRAITLRATGDVTDLMVASYLAKYSTKGTEVTGHSSKRLTPATVSLHAKADGTHAERLIYACWTLGGHSDYASLQRWAHMLGFGGHFLTKARYYSVTFGELRAARICYRRTQNAGPEHEPIRAADHGDEETTLIVGNLSYAGTGWTTTGDALLANTAADQARKRHQAGREEVSSDIGQPGTSQRAA